MTHCWVLSEHNFRWYIKSNIPLICCVNGRLSAILSSSYVPYGMLSILQTCHWPSNQCVVSHRKFNRSGLQYPYDEWPQTHISWHCFINEHFSHIINAIIPSLYARHTAYLCFSSKLSAFYRIKNTNCQPKKYRILFYNIYPRSRRRIIRRKKYIMLAARRQ